MSDIYKYDGTIIEVGGGGSSPSIPNYNPFANKRVLHHLNQEMISYVPAQSLDDVAYASSLGMEYIEANLHKCADGVYVIKHGTQGKLGEGLLSEDGTSVAGISFGDVTSTWLRENVYYNSHNTKIKTHIPTLDEFCSECKKYSLGIIAEYNADSLPIIRKYLTDDKIISAYNPSRGDFKGVITFRADSMTLEQAVYNCNRLGSPCLVWMSDSLTDSQVKEWNETLHGLGCYTTWVYPTIYKYLKGSSLGVDIFTSTYNVINPFYNGNKLNIVSLADTALTLGGGATYNSSSDTISMPNASTLSIPSERFTKGMMTISIRYSGKLTFKAGIAVDNNQLKAYESDGSSIITFAVNLLPIFGGVSKFFERWLLIEANADTTIYEMSVHCSVV